MSRVFHLTNTRVESLSVLLNVNKIIVTITMFVDFRDLKDNVVGHIASLIVIKLS